MEIEDRVQMQRPGTAQHIFRTSRVLKPSHISNVVSDIFVTWDGVTLEFENSNHIAEGIITLAWHKQQIVILENMSSTLLPLAQ